MDDKAKGGDEAADHQENADGVDAALSVYCPEYRSLQARDDAYVAALKAQGVSMKDGTDNFQPLIDAAHDICKLLNDEDSRSDVVNGVYAVHTEGEQVLPR